MRMTRAIGLCLLGVLAADQAAGVVAPPPPAPHALLQILSNEPVVGPLVGRGLKLASLAVVTTTWGKWRRRHPGTQVLSLKTGHDRDYSEGTGYRDYFATDELMFSVQQLDGRIKNKAEVLALRFGGEAARPAAISAALLKKTPVFHGRLGAQDYVVLTDATGANRVFTTGGRKIFRRAGRHGGGRTGPALAGERAGLGGRKRGKVGAIAGTPGVLVRLVCGVS